MNAVAKRQMPVLNTVDIEFGRPLELPLVAVGGADPIHDRCAGGNHLVSQGGLRGRRPVHGLDRRSKAQHFLDGLGKQGWFPQQAVHDARVLSKAQNSIADQFAGGLIACDEQQGAKAQQFGHRQFLPSISADSRVLSRSRPGWLLRSSIRARK